MKPKVNVKSTVFASLVNNRDIPLEVVSKSTGLHVTDLKAMMNTNMDVDQPVLVKLGKVFHKPWTVFLLDSPEEKVDIKQDNRTLQNESHGLGPELVKHIQDALFSIEISSELEPNFKVSLPMANLDLKADAEKKGAEFRQQLGVNEEECKKLTDTRLMLKYWKELFQSKGIYISERGLPLNQVRAFSLLEKGRAAIVLSTKDSYAARSFSLIHEVCHILLNQTGVCDLNDFETKKIERFCNKFAASFLAPEKQVTQLLQQYQNIDNKFEMIAIIAKSLKISKAASEVRLYELGYLNSVANFDLEKYESEKPKRKKNEKSKPGGGNYYATAINAAGVEFSKHIFNAVTDGKISNRDAARFLGVGEKNISTFHTKLTEFNPSHETAS